MNPVEAFSVFLALGFLFSGIARACRDGKEIVVNAKEVHSGAITSPGYPNQVLASSCKYKIQTTSSSTVYVEFTEFDLPRCEDGFVELLSRQQDEDEAEACLGKKDTDTKECEFCNKAHPVPSHSKSNLVTLMIKFKTNSTRYRGFKMLWRSGSYGSYYNWVSDPVNNRKELVLGIVLGLLGLIGLVGIPVLLFWYLRRRGNQRSADQVLVPQVDEDDADDDEF